MATTRKAENKDERDYDPAVGVPGDVTTEPVATAAQNARGTGNRVGPPSIAQDETADWHTPPGVTQIAPGDEAPAETPIVGGRIELPDVEDEFGHDVSEHKSSGQKLAERKPDEDDKPVNRTAGK